MEKRKGGEQEEREGAKRDPLREGWLIYTSSCSNSPCCPGSGLCQSIILFVQKQHRVSTMGHIEESGEPKTLEGGKEQEPARSRKQRKHKILPLEADSGQQGQVTYDMLRRACIIRDSVTPSTSSTRSRDGPPSVFPTQRRIPV